jgi:hypothetical protein
MAGQPAVQAQRRGVLPGIVDSRIAGSLAGGLATDVGLVHEPDGLGRRHAAEQDRFGQRVMDMHEVPGQRQAAYRDVKLPAPALAGREVDDLRQLRQHPGHRLQ